MSLREDFIAAALRLEGRSYIWGAKGPDHFDCSGLVTYCLKKIGGPDWRAFHNCQKLEQELMEVKTPKPGDLALYGKPGHATHVMICMSDGRVFGASGGDSTTLTVKDAEERDARVKYAKHALYRSDLIGYRSMSVFLDQERKP